MLTRDPIAQAGLADWRKLAQGLHARFVVADFAGAVRLLGAVSELGTAVEQHLRARVGSGFVDLELVSQDAIYRDDEGGEHVVERVTQRDVDLAQRISAIAAGQAVCGDPGTVSELELGLDTLVPADIAPVWAALLTGDADSKGRGTPGDEIRDATVRVPNLWFNEVPNYDVPQRFHVEVYVAPEVVGERLAAVTAAGGRIVDDSQSPGLTVISDPAGNRGILCATPSPTDRDQD